MLVRRCKHLFLESKREQIFSLDDVLHGGNGMMPRTCWLALAPHLDAPVEISHEMLKLLGDYDAEVWTATAVSSEPQVLDLIEKGLLLVKDDSRAVAARDERMRTMGWWGPAAMVHWQSRWNGRDSAAAIESAGIQTAAGLQARFGPPPAVTKPPLGTRVVLPAVPIDDADQRLRQRCTCRNFDVSQQLQLSTVSQLLQRVLGATGRYLLDENSVFIKRNAPSAGGLHATEAYIIVQHVDGLDRGIYHYHPLEHALTPMPGAFEVDAGLTVDFVAGQHWFANAHVLIVLAPRFDRLHWKYRDHAKAYRAVTLDVGHLSQLLLTCATELGLGAFVTAAINERDIEQALGFDPMEQSPLAICGFGLRDEVMTTTEFDPGEAVWEKAT